MSFIEKISNFYFPVLRFTDIIEILILIFVIYHIIVGLKNTRAMVLLKGIFVLIVFYMTAYLCSFQAILVIFKGGIAICVVAIIVVFQPEMRKFLEQIGTKKISGKGFIKNIFKKKEDIQNYYSNKSIDNLVKSCFVMSKTKTGALIVIERNIPLSEYVETGIDLNADLTSQLVINIFEKNTPLHDGAVIMVGDRLIAATCYLPLSSSTKISKHMGTRHRAAIGVSEVTDCIVLVVSEETGAVSLVEKGIIQFSLTPEKLTELLNKNQVREIKSVSVSKDTLKKVKKKIFNKHNLEYKILASIVGFLGWIALINVADPVVTTYLNNVPIEIINTSVIESIDKTFELSSEQTVNVAIKDRRSIIDRLSTEDITVIADLSKLSYVNAIPLNGFVEKYPSVEVSFVDENTVNVELDSLISKEFDITIEKKITSDLTTYVPVLNSDIKTIIITGSKSKIDIIDKVVYYCDISNVTGDYTENVTPIIYDKNGSVIDFKNLKLSHDSIEITGKGYNIKEVPVNIALSEDYINGYKVDKLDFEPKKVKIAGVESVLDSFERFDIVLDINSDITNISINNKFVKTIGLSKYLSEGLYLVTEDENLTVTIDFEPLKTKEISFESNNINLKNLNSEYRAVIQDTSFSVTVSGADAELSKLTKENLLPFIDLYGLTEGSYNLILQFSGLDTVTLVSNISVKLVIEKIS